MSRVRFAPSFEYSSPNVGIHPPHWRPSVPKWLRYLGYYSVNSTGRFNTVKKWPMFLIVCIREIYATNRDRAFLRHMVTVAQPVGGVR